MEQARGVAQQFAYREATARQQITAVVDKVEKYTLADYMSYGMMACGALAIVLLAIGIMHGFGSAYRTSQDPSNGVCCTECVQSLGSFLGVVLGVPVAIFVVIALLVWRFAGGHNLKRAAEAYVDVRKDKAAAAYLVNNKWGSFKEATAGKFVIGGSLFLFVVLIFVVFFEGPKFLAGTNLAPDANQSQAKCGGSYTWCVACKPQTSLMLAFSGGISIAALLVGGGLVFAGEKRKAAAA